VLSDLIGGRQATTVYGYHCYSIERIIHNHVCTSAPWSATPGDCPGARSPETWPWKIRIHEYDLFVLHSKLRHIVRTDFHRYLCAGVVYRYIHTNAHPDVVTPSRVLRMRSSQVTQWGAVVYGRKTRKQSRKLRRLGPAFDNASGLRVVLTSVQRKITVSSRSLCKLCCSRIGARFGVVFTLPFYGNRRTRQTVCVLRTIDY